MRNRKGFPIILGLLICLAFLFGVSAHKNAHTKSDPEKMISKIEAALGDEYKKQSLTELAATVTYRDTANEDNKIYYHILKTTFYEENPDEITGLHTEALSILFPVECMDSSEEMKILNCDAALYKKGNVAYLCWTYSPEISYVLEYNPNVVDDLEIIKMAESAKPAE